MKNIIKLSVLAALLTLVAVLAVKGGKVADAAPALYTDYVHEVSPDHSPVVVSLASSVKTPAIVRHAAVQQAAETFLRCEPRDYKLGGWTQICH